MNPSATDIDEISQLRQELADLKDHYEKNTSILLEQIRHLRAQLFGRKSEKILPDSGARPLPLFDMPEPEEQEDEETVTIEGHTRKKRGRKPLPEDLPRVVVEHDIPEEEKNCGCGCSKTRIGEETMEQLDVIPAVFRVIRHIRFKYACPSCEGVEDPGPSVTIAPPVPQVIPKSIASPGLLAYIFTNKFVDHLPFYRQEKILKRHGAEISRTTMCNWAMQTVEHCQPLLNLLEEEVINSHFVQIDETTLQVLMETDRSPTTKSYMWIFRRGDPDKPVLIYKYRPTRAGDVAAAFLRDFQGTVQTDGYRGYDFLDHVEEIRHIGCWAHARRKFLDVVKATGKKHSQSGAANEALKFIKKLYRIEKEARAQQLAPSAIFELRQREAKPVINEFKKWLHAHEHKTLPKSLLGKAIIYSLNQWHRLVGYIEDGYSAIDNNGAENAIRPFVVGRKNWLFSGTPEGAEASALLYSLIETAKANRLEPYKYLRYIFEKLPTASTLEDFEALLPWNIEQDQMTIV